MDLEALAGASTGPQATSWGGGYVGKSAGWSGAGWSGAERRWVWWEQSGAAGVEGGALAYQYQEGLSE